MAVEIYERNKRLNNNFNYSIFKLLFIVYCLFLSIPLIESQCPKERPILKDNTCSLQYCTKLQFQNNECSIANEVIKTQWLTNIIRIGDLNFRYVNFASYSNGDMIIETTACPGNSSRMFYGLKYNGRKFFKKSDSQRTNFYLIEANEQPGNTNKYKYESEIFIATINDLNSNKKDEYIVSVSKSTQYTELYIFDQNLINQIQTKDLFDYEMTSLRFASFSYINNNINYTIIGFTTTINSANYIFVKRLSFSSNELNRGIVENKNYNKDNNYGNSISCFITDQKFIICTYLCPPERLKNRICIIALDQSLNEKKIIYISEDLNIKINDKADSFLKCIHLKEESGIFIFYHLRNLAISNVVIYPIILLKEYISNNFANYITSMDFFKLNKYAPKELLANSNIYFNNYCLKNDLIKVSENKVCFITSSTTNETLYISLINIIGRSDVIVRYYMINIYKLYKHKILLDMRGHLYNKFVALAFSYCPQDNCYTDKSGDHFSAFLLFSYPNGTDTQLNINNYLLNNNNSKIDNIILDLKEKSKIENNIFGYIYYGFIIRENNCENIDLLSADTNDLLNLNEPLDHQKIKLKFKNNNIYDVTDCRIKYGNIYTDPKYIDYEQYIDEKAYYRKDFNESSYNNQKDFYEGKILYYNIIIEKKLIVNCINNCELCLDEDNEYCLTCKFNFTLEEGENNIKKKI